MNVHVYFSVEARDGQAPMLSVLCQDTEGRTIAEWADDATLEALSTVVHKKLPYRLRTWLELGPRGKDSARHGKTETSPF